MQSLTPHTLRHQSEARLRSFTGSELFARTFREGMDLVEETAAYLDGPGRAEARRLSTEASLVYATQSMRLTTRLMQVASWLLVQRSLEEGEMEIEEARADKYRLQADAAPEPSGQSKGRLSFAGLAADAALLPGTLLDLMARADSLHGRIARLDRSLYAPLAAQAGAGEGGEGRTIADQLSRLQLAFADGAG